MEMYLIKVVMLYIVWFTTSNQRMDRRNFFKEGGSGMLLVPSHLGYGSNDSRGIPGLRFSLRLN
jgi:hypothetical protein